MPPSTRILRNGLICVFLFLVAFLIAWPFANMSFDDDWSYIRTAQIFAQTGHVVYNGWSAPILGCQLVWGALFIHLFGFSFTTVKLSTLPVALATVFLFYAVQIRFGITARNAVIGTLALALSPLFMPLAASYMTDIPALFFILLSVYCCQRATTADTSATATGWLCLATALSLAGGTARQIAWLGALVMAPSTAWHLRKRHGVLLRAALLWLAGLGVVLLTMHWFASQPYSVTGSVALWPHIGTGTRAVLASYKGMEGLLCATLLVFPILVAWLPQLGRTSHASRLGIAVALLAWLLFQSKLDRSVPWLENVVLWEFSKVRVADMRPHFLNFLLPKPVSLTVSVLMAATAIAFLAAVLARLRKSGIPPTSGSWGPVFWICVPYTVSYLMLLVPRVWAGVVFDRYVLPIMPTAIVCMIWLYQRWIANRLPASSFVTVALYGLLAIAGTHDWFAWQRARLATIGEIQASGVPRTEIQGGLEYDAWTQVETSGHINAPWVKNPPGTYLANPTVPQVAQQCRLDFAPYTPAVQPRYTIVFAPKWCLQPSPYPPVQFRKWLPPFHSTIYVQQIPKGRSRMAAEGGGTAAAHGVSDSRRGPDPRGS